LAKSQEIFSSILAYERQQTQEARAGEKKEV
jgi:hypothetical protein